LRPQLSFPTQQPELFDFQTGYGFDAMLSYNFMPQLGVYAGWGWNNFRIDDTAELGDWEVDETGYSFGLRFTNPISNNLSYFVGAGGTYKHLEGEDDAGDLSWDSGHELGWEVQGGLILDLGGGFDLRPQITYRSLSATANLGPVETNMDLQYLSIGLALAKRF
ncbi:MAG: outer membrane beta-barrel protein, partial [Salinimicrobium sp.]